MVKSLFAAVAATLSLASSVVAAPTADTPFPALNRALENRDWQPWGNGGHGGHGKPCNNHTIQTRYSFESLKPEERQNYTNAINCLRSLPSQLNQTQYPAAINRYFDYAVLHVGKTRTVHLDGFFLVWHRMFIHLFEQDLRQNCQFTAPLPYWDWPATAANLTGSKIFDGSEYSMSGDGYFTNDDPIVLAPGFAIPHGSGGGCIKSGPFKGMNRTMDSIAIQYLINGTEPPQSGPNSVYNRHESCLTRDLNEFAATTWTNYTDVTQAIQAPNMTVFNVLINGVIGGTSLGIHSGAHFILGDPGSNIFVSVQDPVWWPLHTMLDRVYHSWQVAHPDIANQLEGTMTAVNAPPSANVTLSSVVPDFGYFGGGKNYTINDLISTTAGPFCYQYDSVISP